MEYTDVDEETNRITGIIVDEGLQVHRTLGPGLYEWVYRECLAKRLRRQSLKVACEVTFPAFFDGERLDSAFRVDMDIEAKVLVELKAVPLVEPAAFAQLRTYLRTSGREVGLLMNFHAPRFVDGLYRVRPRAARPPREG